MIAGMTTDDADTFPPDEAQRRFEALVRAAINTPPTHRQDGARKEPESNRKARKAAKPFPSTSS